MITRKAVVTSIASGKGGVGKTFLSANLAACLARAGKKVLVVDCDLGLANMDIMLGIAPTLSLQDVAFGDTPVQDIIISTGAAFDLVPASSGVKEMGQLIYEKIEMIKDALKPVFAHNHIDAGKSPKLRHGGGNGAADIAIPDTSLQQVVNHAAEQYEGTVHHGDSLPIYAQQ